MTTNHQPPTPPDDVDRLLSAYFRAQMPARWPAAPRPTAEKAQAATSLPAGDPTARSRWALATSVALLLGGCWYLAGHSSDGRPRKPGLDDTSANSKHVRELASPKGTPAGKVP